MILDKINILHNIIWKQYCYSMQLSPQIPTYL